MTAPALEIAVTSAIGAMRAIAAGADRVELCSALELGGVTPSAGLVEAAVAAGIESHVLVRSRPGDFVYDADEAALMALEAAAIARAGADGVVIGALLPDGSLDLVTIARIADAARSSRPGIHLTLHRAIDRSADPVAAVATLAGTGVGRVLTSGGAAAAGDGAATISAMARAAAALPEPLEIMAGGGVVPAAIPALLAAGATAVHLSARHPVGDHQELDPALVREARNAFTPR